MKRRTTAIVISAIAVIALVIALIFVLDYVKTLTFDDVDGQTYYIRKRDGSYSMYDGDRVKLNTDAQYGYYITDIGTLVKVDAETGEYEVIAVVDTEGNEVVGYNSRLLLFPHIEKKNILSLKVHNAHGEYTFVRVNEEGNVDASGDFIIESSPLTSYDQELFASLYVGAGYTLSLLKLEDPIKDANGEFTEYGLAAQTRYRTEDKDGNPLETPEEYAYEPTWYVLTDTSGNQYKVIVGDALVTGGGYYVQYVDMSGETESKRDAVYVLDSDTGSCMNAPIEDYVTPMLSYPMSMNTYFDVEDFTIGQRLDNAKPGDTTLYQKIIAFSYVDLSLRENTLNSSRPYEFSLKLDGYIPSSTNVDSVLYTLYSPTYIGVPKLSPTPEDLEKYGIYAKELDETGNAKTDEKGDFVYTPFSAYTISFKYDILDDDGNCTSTIHQMILISEKNENGNYYAYTAVSNVTEKDGKETLELLYTYDMVVELDGHSMAFLEWDQYEWVSNNYIDANIAFVDTITISSPNYSATFRLDNSLSDQSNGTDSSNLIVNATDSKGNDISSFGKLEVTDKWGVKWVITSSDIKVYGADGSERKIKDGESYYDYNKLSTQVLCKNNPIECDGKKVEVKADTVRVIYTDENGNATGVEETYVRYDTGLFRKFYQTLLYASIVDSYNLTEEKEAELLADSSKWLLTITVTTKDVDGTTETNTFSFYQLSSRKAYITINGNGGFYVMKNRVDKFISDAQRFFAYEVIDPTAKT